MTVDHCCRDAHPQRCGPSLSVEKLDAEGARSAVGGEHLVGRHRRSAPAELRLALVEERGDGIDVVESLAESPLSTGFGGEHVRERRLHAAAISCFDAA